MQSAGCSHTSTNSHQLARDRRAPGELSHSRTNVTPMANDAAGRWADDLASWGIPGHILSAAPRSPWIHPVSSFIPKGNLFVDTPSRHRALDALDGIDSPSVLDVGCGGGRGVFGLTPPATHVVGVDQQQEMLDVVNAQGADRGLSVATVLGKWPAVAHETSICDVAICHHVVYNVSDLVPFIEALTSHARRRVVLQLPTRHPLSHLSDAWKRFWDLDRPVTPTAHDALAVVQSTGVSAHLEKFETEEPPREVTDLDVEHMRVRLCLTPDRDADIREFLQRRHPRPRTLAAIWWDV